MRYQFGSGRQQLPFSASNVAIVSGNNSTARTLYLAIAGENPAGVNLLSNVVGPITVNPGEAIAITLGEGLKLEGEAWDSILIAASDSPTPNSFVQLAKVSLAEQFLPYVLTLSEDDHLSLPTLIASVAQLPDSALHGALRAITELNSQVFEYNLYSRFNVNGSTVLPAVTGRWLLKPGNFSAYVGNTSDPGGCDRPLYAISDNLIRAPRYACAGGAGTARTYWLVNDALEPVAAGRRVGFTTEVNDIPQGNAYDGLLRCIFQGYANVTTGTLRTLLSTGEELSGVGLDQPYFNRKTDLHLVDDLQPGEAYVLTVYPEFTVQDTNNQAPNKGVLSGAPFIFKRSGNYTEAGDVLGNWIYAKSDRGFVVPQLGLVAKALKRSGMVNSLSFKDVGPTLLVGFQPDTANQLVAIDGDGDMYVVSQSDVDDTLAIRAIVSSKKGVSRASAWSDPITVLDGVSLRVSCTYPSNGSTAVIRPDYPDLIAGLSGKAQLNFTSVVLYLELNGEVRAFRGNPLLDGASQEFDVLSWNDGEPLTAVPAATGANFCLFEPVGATAVSQGGGSFPAGIVRVSFAFENDGSAISSISHNEQQGCIHTGALTVAEMELADQAWAPIVEESDVAVLPQSAIVPWQTRRTTMGKRIIYRPDSRREHNGVSVWKPVWKDVNAPGRWEMDGSALTMEEVLPFILALGG